MHDDFLRERSQQRQQSAAQIAESHEGERLAVQEKRIVVVALEFLADPQRGIGLVHAPREGNRHRQGQLGDRLRIDRRGGEHRNFAPVTLGIVDVRQEIALDVEHRAQMRRPVESPFVQRRLSDQCHSLRQIPVDVFGGGGRTVVPDHTAEFFEATFGRLIEDAFDPARMRIKQNDRFVWS